MMPVDPRPLFAPSNGRYVVIAKDQEGVRPLPALLIGGHVLTRWHLSDEERAALVAGDDVWLDIVRHGHPVQPVALATKPTDLFMVDEPGAPT